MKTTKKIALGLGLFLGFSSLAFAQDLEGDFTLDSEISDECCPSELKVRKDSIGDYTLRGPISFDCVQNGTSERNVFYNNAYYFTSIGAGVISSTAGRSTHTNETYAVDAGLVRNYTLSQGGRLITTKRDEFTLDDEGAVFTRHLDGVEIFYCAFLR